jgi:hypothetical protein
MSDGLRFRKKAIALIFIGIFFPGSALSQLNPPRIVGHHYLKDFGRNLCNQLSFELDYQSSPDPIHHCNVYLNGEFLKEYPQCQDKSNKIGLNLQHLLDQTTYFVQIQAIDAEGHGSRLSLPYFAKTKKCKQPEDAKLGVFLINFADFKNVKPWSPTRLESNYFEQENYLGESLNLETWFNLISYGDLKISHQISGLLTLPLTKSQYCAFSHQGLGYSCSTEKIIEDFKKVALQSHVNLNFDRNVLVISGIGVIRKTVDKFILLSAQSTRWNSYNLPVLAYAGLVHELGHALGLSNNGAFYGNCYYPVSLTNLDRCRSAARYGSSVMSEDGRGFNSEERRLLGLISNEQILSVTEKTQVFVAKISSLNKKSKRDIKQVRIRRDLPGFYADTFFFLDYRHEDRLYATLDMYGRAMSSGVYVSLRRSVLNGLSHDAMIVDIEKPLTLERPELYMPEHQIYLKLLEKTPEYALVLIAKNTQPIGRDAVPGYSEIPFDQLKLDWDDSEAL